MNDSSPLIVIVGPTASGKSDLAISLARSFQGEILSADSRQIYRGLDIGSGKVTKREQRLVPHWLLDVASPKRSYSITHFLRDSRRILRDIDRREKLPIFCGGTHFWVQSFLEEASFPPVPPNPRLRKRLGARPTDELFSLLKKRDPKRARDIDPKNRHRLIRALEVVASLGTVPRLSQGTSRSSRPTLIIALVPPHQVLRDRIRLRLERRLRRGMIAEVRKLRESEHLSWKRLESFGLEYRYVSLFVRGLLSRDAMIERLFFEIWHFAKRQITWLKRWERQGTSIHWCSDETEAKVVVNDFFKKYYCKQARKTKKGS